MILINNIVPAFKTISMMESISIVCNVDYSVEAVLEMKIIAFNVNLMPSIDFLLLLANVVLDLEILAVLIVDYVIIGVRVVKVIGITV